MTDSAAWPAKEEVRDMAVLEHHEALLGRGIYDIRQRDGTTILRFYETDESDAPAYSCAFVRDETRPNGFQLVDVFEGR